MIGPSAWLIIAAVLGLTVWIVGKRHVACGVTLGIAALLLLLFLFIISATFSVSGIITLQ